MARQEHENIVQRADERMRKSLPPGVRLLHTLRGHTGTVGRIAWSRRMLASPSSDGTVRLWDVRTGKCLRTLKGQKGVMAVAFDPQGTTLAGGCLGGLIVLWRVPDGEVIGQLVEHAGVVNSLAFVPHTRTLVSGGSDGTCRIWDTALGRSLAVATRKKEIRSVVIDPGGQRVAVGDDGGSLRMYRLPGGELLYTLSHHGAPVGCVAFSRRTHTLASASADRTIQLWDSDTGRGIRTLEGHTGPVSAVAFSPSERVLASKGIGDGIRLWSVQTGACLCVIPDARTWGWAPGLSFHPRLPLLATVGADAYPRRVEGDHSRVIRVWKLDDDILLGRSADSSSHYVNAKAVLVGDTGVGKTGLSLVLNNQPFAATDSTPGRRVWTFDSREVKVAGNVIQTRETLLWDLAGQPGYRVIHQLHLNEVAVALVVFDARSETDPLAGVRHWERALRLAQQRQGNSGVPMKKFLVSARNDRGGVSIGEDRLQGILKDFSFDGYFKTSAKEGWEIDNLRAAIERAIAWEDLPEISSSQLFADIKSFLLEVKKTGQLLAPAGQLYDEFIRQHSKTAATVANLRDQFDTCIGRLENRDLIRRLTFGGYVLLQPELLDAYASAMVNTAKEEPDGLGSMAEEIALAGKFFVPKEQKVTDAGQEQLLLHATVEELVAHDLALRENADDGRYLVFPSQFNRDYEDAPDPKGKAVAIAFDGPVQSLYATLAVRLGHSGLFTTRRVEMWRNAAVFTARAGGKCGLFLHEFAEARGRLILFFPDEQASAETRFHFEEFVVAHANRRALDGTIDLVRFFVCSNGHPVPDGYVRLLRDQGKNAFNCPCGVEVSLAEPEERMHFPSKVEAMDQSADRQRDFDAFVMSAKGEMRTTGFHEWAGGERVMLAIVFTDMVGSVALGREIGDEGMNEVRNAHFAQGRKLLAHHGGREIKTIGDSFMAAFHCADRALDFALALRASPGHPRIKIRAGIHAGPLQVEGSDVFGTTVDFAARVIRAIQGPDIALSDRAKKDVDHSGLLDADRRTVLHPVRDRANKVKCLRRLNLAVDRFQFGNNAKTVRRKLQAVNGRVWSEQVQLKG